jgi:hypothetical protein
MHSAFNRAINRPALIIISNTLAVLSSYMQMCIVRLFPEVKYVGGKFHGNPFIGRLFIYDEGVDSSQQTER